MQQKDNQFRLQLQLGEMKETIAVDTLLKLLKKLFKANVPPHAFQKMIDLPGYWMEVLSAIKYGGYQDTPDHIRTEIFLGRKQFISMREVIDGMQAFYLHKHFVPMAEIPLSEDDLQQIRDKNQLLFPGMPYELQHLQKVFPRKFWTHSHFPAPNHGMLPRWYIVDFSVTGEYTFEELASSEIMPEGFRLPNVLELLQIAHVCEQTYETPFLSREYGFWVSDTTANQEDVKKSATQHTVGLDTQDQYWIRPVFPKEKSTAKVVVLRDLKPLLQPSAPI